MVSGRNRNRDAHATFAGFVFQVNVTILRWLNLLPGQHLELEAGEDIDLIQTAAAHGLGDARRLEQVKQLRRKRLTLRSADALEAIANFCQHRKSSSVEKLTFRFLTTTSARKERKWAGNDSGIVTWEKIRKRQIQGDARASGIGAIKDFLKNCIPAVPKGVRESFTEALSGNDDEFGEIIDSFEWAMESGDHEIIEKEVLVGLENSDPPRTLEVARRVYRDLFAFVFHLLTQPGPKRLTRELLAGEIRVTREDLLAAARLRGWIDKVDEALGRHEKDIKELKGRIPVGRAKTFYEPETSAEYTSRNGPLFDFNQTLRGRQTRLAELDSFLSNPAKKIAVLPGRGGIGKTKLMRDWSRGKGGWKILWVSQHGVWHEGSISEIPPTNTLIIADDAHLYDDLDKIVSVVSSRSGELQLKLLIGTRPSGVARIDEMLARLANGGSIVRYKKLSVIRLRATVEIAKEVLGPDYEHLADRLAEVSKDTPLITVVGGKLIARSEITPDLLVNHQDFRTEVFSKFHEERTGELPSSGRPNSVLLALIAAVQPVDVEKDDFVANAAVFLSLRPDQIHDGIDYLEAREVLVRGAGKLRIVPDLFADYLLELASIYPDGKPKGYADAVFTSFEQTYLSNLLRNFGELDWRITRDGKDSRLLNEIWALILKRFRGQDAADRRHFLRTAQQIAVFQPEHVHKLIKIAMDEPASSIKKWGIIRSTQVHILAQLPAMLGVTIYNEKTSADAFARLWELSHHDSSEVSGQAQRTLKSAIGYERYKHPIYNERVLEFVDRLAEATNSYNSDFTPLDLVRELLAREVKIEEWRGVAFTFTMRPVDYELTRRLRDRALRIIDCATYSSNPRIAVLAARSFIPALSEFHPTFRPGITPEEQDWQDKERLDVLGMLRQRLNGANVSLPLIWKIHRILRSIERGPGQSATVRTAAAALHKQLPRPDLFELFDVLCTNEYEDNTESDGFGLPSLRRRNQQDSAIAALQERLPNGEDQVDAIEQLLQQAIAAGIKPDSGVSVLSQMCRSRVFLEGFSEYALKKPRSILATCVGIAVERWRYIDRPQFSRYGALFARSQNVRTAESVASSVSQGPVHELLTREDLEILTILANRNEPGVLHAVIWGLKRLTRVDAFRPAALDLIAGMKIGGHRSLAGEYCDIFGPYGLSAAILNRALVEKMFANLVEVEQLNHHSLDCFMATVCGVAPKAIVFFLESRITHAIALQDQGVDSDYEPIPSSSSWSVLKAARTSPEYKDALRGFVDLMKRYPRYEHQISRIFWRMGDIWPPDDTGTETFAALDCLLHTSNSDDVLIVLRSLDDAPLGLTIFHSMFALHVLWTCAEYGEEFKAAAMARLTGNCFASGGAQAVQPGASITVRSGLSEPWQKAVAELLAKCEPGTLDFELFKRIADAAQPVFHTLDLADVFDGTEDPEEE